ncbi:alpha/beta hydrolase family protein [Paenibacillus kobensis]|uniref:alpha/beta hydrolase family protein n=1 Tax=Paenibacillus kobensis TaxID=59841 RepID=UPI0013E35C21|nr:alpha/beta fold hydrolase [Paenibacillus kobensis]
MTAPTTVTTTVCGIPCLVVHPSMKPKGTIVLYHGWISTIHDYSFFASLIAGWGYKVIVPELPHHGDRGTLDYFDTSVLQQYFWQVGIEGVREAESIVSELIRMDANIGVMGHSTGGFISAGLFAADTRVQASIVISGSCAWVKAEQLFRERDGRTPMTAEERRVLAQYDPESHCSFDRNRGLLLLHGENDHTIPIDSQQYFIESMSSRQIPLDKLQFLAYPNVGHHVTIAMLEKSKQWLDSHLH